MQRGLVKTHDGRGLMRLIIPAVCSVAVHALSYGQSLPVIINEVLANEPGARVTLEWVELYNRSVLPVDLSSYVFVDGVDSTVLTGLVLSPGGYAVLARYLAEEMDPDATFESRWGDNSGVWGDSEQERYPAMNAVMRLRNTADTVRLLAPDGATSTCRWESDIGDGISIERLRPESPDEPGSFRPSQEASGSTPGRINSRTPRDNDLAFDTAGVTVTPYPPREDNPVTFTFTVRNIGNGPSLENVLTASEDTNSDGLVDSNEVRATLNVPSLEEGGSILLSFTSRFTGGVHVVVLTLGADGNPANNTARHTFKMAYAAPELVINEYLADPVADGPEEWIELYNRSDHSVLFSGWQIRDQETLGVFISAPILLYPGQYAVVCENPRAFATVYPAVEAKFIGETRGWRKLNNTGDRIILVDMYGYVVDSLSFGMLYGGRSVERIDADGPSGDADNWGGSLDPMGGTPGRVNSLTARPNDLAINANAVFIFSLPDPPREHSALQLVVIVTNVGKDTSRANMLTIADDTDFDGEAGEGETLAVLEIPALVMKQADTVWYVGVLSGGVHRVLLFLGDDGNALNNTAVVRFKVAFASAELVINEFMAAPEAGGSEEWIELYNRSGHSVDMYGWRLGDSLAQQPISAESLWLQSGEFFLVCADTTALRARYDLPRTAPLCQMSGWRALNDTGDRIVLVDDFGYAVDALGYTESVAGRSWERVDPDERSDHPLNWRTSIDPAGATPGRINSMTRRANDLALDSNGIRIAPFPPLEGVAVTFSIRVRNCGLGASAANVLTIIETTQSAEGSHREDTLAMLPIPGMNVNDSLDLFSRQVFSGGRRTVACHLGGDDNALNNAAVVQFKVLFTRPEVVINEYLPDPATGGSEEWIELYNRSGHDVDLRNWRIGDSISQAVVAAEKKVLAPGSYAVVCENLPAFATAYAGIDPFLVVEVDGWRALNDTGDRIVLVDDFGYLIDSLTYRTAYDGRSVERIDPERASGDPDNWWGSVDPAGATPGRRNSTAVGYADVLHVSVSPNPFIAGEQVHIDYAVPFRATLTARVYDVNGRKIKTLVENQPVASGALFWDGRDDEGRMLQPGAYVLLCETNGGQARKIVLAVRPTK